MEQRKIEMALQAASSKQREEEDAQKRDGMIKVSEEERLQTLKMLEQSKKEGERDVE